MKRLSVVGVVVMMLTAVGATAQNYTSLNDGAWTTAANWNNTSGWGTATPLTNGTHGSGTISMNHNMTLTGNYNTGSPVLNIAANKTLTITGDFTLTGGGTVNVSGILQINGNATLMSNLNILPGGTVIVNGTMQVNDAPYLTVGTNAAAPPGPFANLVIKTNYYSYNSGDMTINKNGRVAVFGNVTNNTGGDSQIVINNGGQTYVNGNMNFIGGGDDIVNNNPSSPYGLYVNGTTTNSGGGSTTTANKGNKTTMQTTNPPFYAWVASLPGSPLPVSLIFFNGEVSGNDVVLNWATAIEINFDYFSVEQSTDGVSFIEIAQVPGHGSTKERHDYSFVVINPMIGKSYFRLTSVDFDGYQELFHVVAINSNSDKSMVIYPNPVTDGAINVNVNFKPVAGMLVMITDLNGAEVYRTEVSEITNRIELPVNPGTYILKASVDGVTKVTRIAIR